MAADARIGGAGGAQQFGHERRGNERVQVHIEAVETPAQPRGNSRSALFGRKRAEWRFGRGRRGVGRIRGSRPTQGVIGVTTR